MVEAVRRGYWIVLDELNLAPSEVLEALNRLLDDNRELFIPETQQTIKPHPNFLLFATQNPPGIYGGRKVLFSLSRTFSHNFLFFYFLFRILVYLWTSSCCLSRNVIETFFLLWCLFP